MSHKPNENDDDNRTAASDFVKIEQPDEVPGQEAQQEEHFDLHQNPLLDWTMKTESTSAVADDNDGNDLKELKVMIAKLEAKNQALQGKVENLESKAENRALKENAEQKALETRLKDEFAEMLSAQNEQHQSQLEQLKTKNRQLEEKLAIVELQTIENGVSEQALDGKMKQLKDEFSKMLSEQQRQMMAQFQAQINSLEQKLKEADQHAQMENNEVEEIIQANQEMEMLQIDIDENEMPQSDEGDEEKVEDEEEDDKEEVEDEEEDGDEEGNDEEEEATGEEDEDDEEPPRNITKMRDGKKKKYRLLKTVKSMEELDKFRFKNYCEHCPRKPEQILRSHVMPCIKKKRGKTCTFELMAVPSADLDCGDIHIYAYSEHSNHPLKPRTKRGIYRKGEMMPDANPPAVYPMDDIEWTFQGTFPDNGKLNKFRYEHECNHTTDRGCTRFRFYCRCRYTNDCNFMLLAMKTTKKRYHVYKHGEHSEHPARKSKKDQTDEDEDDDDDYEEKEIDEEEEGEDEEEETDEEEIGVEDEAEEDSEENEIEEVEE